MNWVATCALVSTAGVPADGKPLSAADAVRYAVADARRLDPATAKYTRYLSLHTVPAHERGDYLRWLTFQLWSLSHEGEPGRPRPVARHAAVVAIDLREYGIDPLVYGRLAYADPYFHLATTADGKQPAERGLYATWLPYEQVTELAERTGGSRTAILRADWFVVQVSIQDGRGKAGEGTGYYDFLGVTTRDEFQRFVGFDAKLAAGRKAEWRAIVESSGVAFFPRQIARFGAVDAGYWVTFDVLDDARGPRNAMRQLDGDYRHQAEEHYGVGPSGLFAFFLSNQDGVLQDAAPDKIGPDKTRQPSNRTRIENGASCVRCHLEGLRPIDNWAREALKLPTVAGVPADKATRLRQLYFRDLEAKRRVDNLAYAERLRECNGLAPAANAKLYGRLWDRYVEDRLGVDDCARECGTTPGHFREALHAVRAQGKLDPAFAGLVLAPPRPIRRDVWEEVFPAAMLYLGGIP